MFLAIGRPRPVPPRLVVKYGSKTRGRCRRRRCRRRCRRRRSTTCAVGGRPRRQRTTRARRAGGIGLRSTWRALTIRLTSASRSRSASVDDQRQRRVEIEVDRAAPAPPAAAAADSRQSALRSAGASSNRIGRAKSSTSLTIRLRRATSSSMSAAASRSAAALGIRLAERVQRRLDDHQRIPHLVRDDRRQAAERRQPFLLRHLALEPRDRIGQRVERRRQQPRVLVVPARPPRSTILRVRSPVAATSRITPVIVGERPGDGARDREAEKRREQHRDDRGHRQLGVDRAEEAQVLGPRPEDQRDRPGARQSPAARRRTAAAAARRYSSVPSVTLRAPRRARSRSASAGRSSRRQRASRGSGRPCRTRSRCR